LYAASIAYCPSKDDDNAQVKDMQHWTLLRSLHHKPSTVYSANLMLASGDGFISRIQFIVCLMQLLCTLMMSMTMYRQQQMSGVVGTKLECCQRTEWLRRCQRIEMY